MAIARQNTSVSRGYKPKRARANKTGPNVVQHVIAVQMQTAREIMEFARDEILYATIDTLHLLEYVRYALRRETRARVAPVMHEWETFVHEHEPVKQVSTFAVEPVNDINVRTVKR